MTEMSTLDSSIKGVEHNEISPSFALPPAEKYFSAGFRPPRPRHRGSGAPQACSADLLAELPY
jgi:hypothetical protein